jgi:hypothetical protein
LPVRARLRRLRAAAWQGIRLAAAAFSVMLLAAAASEAQPRTGADALARHKKETSATPLPKGPLLAVVSISRQRIQVYDRTGVVAQAPVSTGMAGHRTPTGVFSILQRSRHHRSNIYSNAPMPYMQRLTWSGIALHAGVLPGYPASHGCIRMPYAFAAELWGMARLGTRVVVAPDDAAPAEIEHPRLPAPRPMPLPLPEGAPDAMSDGADPAAEGVGANGAGAAAGVRVADAEGRYGPSSARAVDPYRHAVASKAKAAADASAATGAARSAAEAAAVRAAEARAAGAVLRKAESVLADARRRHERTERAAHAAVPGTPAAERAVALLATAEEALAEALRVADEAWLLEAAAAQQGFEATAAAAEAEDASRAAGAAAKAAERSLQPISILVSRKAGRVFVRQGWVPVHEAPVAFAPNTPALGTHLYLAVGRDGGAGEMRWLSVSLPATRQSQPRHRPATAAAAAAQAPETAAGALGRFELPAETRRFIEERLWAGASLIVSDHAGSETGIHTDFIVLAR